MRLTKIVCTLGPASNAPEQIAQLANAGMNVARLNMSHGTQEQHAAVIKSVRTLSEKRKKTAPYKHPIGILCDICGDAVRTGTVKEHLIIRKGEKVIFSYHPHSDDKHQVVRVSHKHFAKDVAGTDRILLDNGELGFDIVSINKNGTVLALAREDGRIGSRRHVNLPGADLTMPSFTTQDWDDIAFATKQKVDFLGLSFIRKASDVQEVRDFLRRKKSQIRLISKIETRQSVDHIREIIDASDGIMVARGDLGVEIPFERVPVVQDQIVMLCRAAGKPVIVATQMLESMVNSPHPTRAEVTDIAHAATTGTDATMLSGETANGKNPLAALDAMDRVLRATEEHLAGFGLMDEEGIEDERDARAQSAVRLAVSSNARAILVFTKSGRTCLDVTRFRPRLPVIACTESQQVYQSLSLAFGTLPVQMPLSSDPEVTVRAALAYCNSLGLLKKNDNIVIISDARAKKDTVSTIQVRTVA